MPPYGITRPQRVEWTRKIWGSMMQKLLNTIWTQLSILRIFILCSAEWWLFFFSDLCHCTNFFMFGILLKSLVFVFNIAIIQSSWSSLPLASTRITVFLCILYIKHDIFWLRKTISTTSIIFLTSRWHCYLKSFLVGDNDPSNLPHTEYIACTHGWPSTQPGTCTQPCPIVDTAVPPLFTQPCPGRTMSTAVGIYVAGLCASCPAV